MVLFLAWRSEVRYAKEGGEMSNSWYPRYYGDYMRDTGHLTLMEHGAYTKLLDQYYATQRPLPERLPDLYRMCSAMTDEEKEAVASVADQFFAVNGDGKRHNRRADIEILKEQSISASRSEAGSKRWQSRNKCIANAKQLHSKPHACDATSTSTSTEEHPEPEPESKTDTPDGVSSVPLAKPRRKRTFRYPADFEAAWQAFGNYGSKPKAAAYWARLTEEDRATVEAAIEPYLKCIEAGRAKKQFEGWINPENRLWEMDWAAALAELTRPIKAREVLKPEKSRNYV